MSQAPAAAPEAPAPVKSGRRRLGWIIVCLLSIVAGAVVPMLLGAQNMFGSSHADKKAPEEAEHETVPFGDVAVNLSEGRMTRYLRIKIVLQVEHDDAEKFTKHLEKRKPVLKDWLIGHLSGKTLKDVGGTVGVKRIQREIHERFEELLYPHGGGKPFEVLFEEFVVQ